MRALRDVARYIRRLKDRHLHERQLRLQAEQDHDNERRRRVEAEEQVTHLESVVAQLEAKVTSYEYENHELRERELCPGCFGLKHGDR